MHCLAIVTRKAERKRTKYLQNVFFADQYFKNKNNEFFIFFGAEEAEIARSIFDTAHNYRNIIEKRRCVDLIADSWLAARAERAQM